MGKIYSNSLLNIGALDSGSPICGLFRHFTSKDSPTKIRWSPTRQDEPILFYLEHTYSLIDRYEGLTALGHDLEYSPLMGRGWVLQECVLAPRMLSFGRRGILWQCSQLAATSGYPYGFISDFVRGHYVWRLPFWMLKNTDVDNKSRMKKIKAKWINTLDAYWQSRLTYPEKDIFAALNGIGAEVAKFSGSEFRYGILASTFPEALLYKRKHDQMHRFIRNKTKPTWH
ncbi:hypothetical protein GGR58DRAFT_294776 [Xylaria digitata]|nr:hypothetical protein GGR58DRAFT_294776 [Xylaria digitata]